ncbi:MAG TPA: energy transducer TonB [Stellaceae bacterium]|jgi:protein TonB|nr:energy transducer TonB [Stellaceae bacterium]
MTQTTTLATGPRLDEDAAAAQTRERRRFRTAMWLSASSHALVIALLYLLWQPVGEEQIPLPPIPITVIQEKEGQSGAMGGGDSETAASSASAASAPESASEPTPSTAEPELRQPTPPIETPPEPSAEVPSLAQTQITPAPAPQETAEPVPQHKPRPPQPKPPPPHTEATQTTPTPATPEPAAQQPTTASETPSQSASASDADQPLPPGAGGRGRGDAGAGRAAVGNGSLEGPGDNYLDAVRRWVQRYRKYPDEAVKQKQEGVVQLGFKFTRDGTVIDAWIEKSSGFPLLDQAALNMIRAASPIPKVPDRYQGDTLTLVMPENFRIGLFDRLFH